MSRDFGDSATRRRLAAAISGLAVAVLTAMPAAAQITISTEAIADTGIYEYGTGAQVNFGVGTPLYIGNPGTGGDESATVLVAFSLGDVPANQTITSATLKMYLGQGTVFFGSGSTMDVFRLLPSWVEGDGNAANGGGTTGATWNSRDKAGSLPDWTVGGARGLNTDRAPVRTGVVGALTDAPQTLSIDVTSDVVLWYSGAAPNNGWALQATTYNPNHFAGFAPREISIPEQRPTLEITYVSDAPAENADFDDDGDVDGADFLLWQRGLGFSGAATLLDGDADGNMTVNADDLDIWRTQFGTPGGTVASFAPVPEPATAIPALVACLAGIWSARRRHQSLPSHRRRRLLAGAARSLRCGGR